MLHHRILHNVTDVEGRYTIVHVVIEGHAYLIINSYARNVDDGEFFWRVWWACLMTSGSSILWGGDFNLVLNKHLDCSNPTISEFLRVLQRRLGI